MRRAADQPDQAGTFPSVDDGQGVPIRQGGDSGFDTDGAAAPVHSPVGSRAPLPAVSSFDFRFLSEEYPSRLGSAFNDAFIAEVDNGAGVDDVGTQRSRRPRTSPRRRSASR